MARKLRTYTFVVAVFLWGTLFTACGRVDTPTPPPSSPTTLPATVTQSAPSPIPEAPTPTPLPGAPQVLSIEPMRGEELAPGQPVRIRFDRAITADSILVSADPPWEGEVKVADQVVSFQPASFVAGQRYTLALSASANGIDTGPLHFTIFTQGYLEVVNTSPDDGSEGVATDAPITIVFNRPVVPLGSDGADPSLPQPLTLEPAAAGRGTWLNTSIYSFQPETALAAGIDYQAIVAGVQDVGGSPMAGPYAFRFTTDVPKIRQIETAGEPLPPTRPITVTFSQPMNMASTEGATSLSAGVEGEPIVVATAWSDDRRVMTLSPVEALPLGEDIVLEITTEALAYESDAGLPETYRHVLNVVPYPAVIRTKPKDGSLNASIDEPVQFLFNTQMSMASMQIDISPPISATQVYSWYSDYDQILTLYFPRQALTAYTVTLAAGVQDPYGNAIPEPTQVRFVTGEYSPSFSLHTPGIIGTYNAYEEPVMMIGHINLDDVNAALYRLAPATFASLNPDQNYERWQRFRPKAEDLVRQWTTPLGGERNVNHLHREPLNTPAGDPIPPGLYYLSLRSPQLSRSEDDDTRTLLVHSRYNTVIKRGDDDVLVWVTDLADGQPVPDLPVTIYPPSGDPRSGRTDAQGLFQTELPPLLEPWLGVQAFVGSAEDPGWANSAWNQGINAWDYSLPAEFYMQEYRIHLYTERPLYRSGDTVYFRAIVREDDDAIYNVPGPLPIEIRLLNPQGEVVHSQSLTTDSYGSVHGQIPLSSETELGVYSLTAQLSPENSAWTNFLVAAFRKPEYELQAAVAPREVIATQPASAQVTASYFFGGPVKRAQVDWTVFSAPYYFTYDDGKPWSFVDFQPDAFYRPSEMGYRQPLASGEGRTSATGQFSVEMQTELLGDSPDSELRTVDFRITDVNDQEVATSTDLVVHAAMVYPGIRPQRYVGATSEEETVLLIAVDALSKQPIARQQLMVTVSQIAWRTVRQVLDDGSIRYSSQVDETEVLNQRVTTDEDGLASLTWTPTTPGQYLLRAIARDELGNVKRSAAFTWIAGDDYAPWRVSNDDRIEMVVDQDQYQVGDVARVLMPSPFQGDALALITIERAGVLSHEIREVASNSETLEIPILPEYAPNVFVSAVLIYPPSGEDPATFKMGIAQLNVDPSQHMLNVDLVVQPSPALPGDTVTYDLTVTDHLGQGVPAQVSLAMVDKALLSLRPDSGPTIDQTFWRQRGLGVQTGVALTVSMNRIEEALSRGTKGGGGGGDMEGLATLDVRSDFRDLAFWQADVTTDAQGKASIQVPLPDNVTTWEMRAVAVTVETAVAEERKLLLVTKPLLIRPVLPRFVVHGDQFTLGVIVQNNTGSDQHVILGFEELVGLIPAEGAPLRYEMDIPSGELQRIDLNVSVLDIDPASELVLDEVRLQMAATTEDNAYDDRVAVTLPVRRYSTPETYASSGVVPADEPRYEAVLLPQRYDPTQGDLTVRLDASLAAGMTTALDYLQHYPYECTEQTLSRFLPNMVTARALADLELDAPTLQSQLEEQVGVALQRLYTRQNADGGWGWFAQEVSNPYTSAYVLFGLTLAKAEGYAVDPDVMGRGARFLQGQITPPAELQGYELNQQAFFVYVLDMVAQGMGEERPLAEAQLLFAERHRLALYAQAYLAMTLQAQSDIADTGTQARSVLERITGEAIVTATGANWEEAEIDWQTMSTDVRTTAVVLSAITQIQPDHALGPQVVRWLMSARRNERWQSTHENVWVILGLTDWMVTTAELRPDYDWKVALNGNTTASGRMTAVNVTESQRLRYAIAELLPDQLNALMIERSSGPGQLYYSTYLNVYLPVAEVAAIDRGLSISRRYLLNGSERDDPIAGARIGDIIDVELTLVVPRTLHYFVLEDPIPAGTEPINTSLATTSQIYEGPQFDQDRQDKGGWWSWAWQPTAFELKDDRVALFATTLAPGTHTFRYQLRASIAGDFNVLPPRGEMMYFPEVFGHGAGSSFRISRP